MNRRDFISNSVIAFFSSFAGLKYQIREGFQTENLNIKIGICADIHLDTIHDGRHRLTAFIDDMINEKPDFIIQLGDFCSPFIDNKTFLKIWNRYKGPKHHVIGNHDQDNVEGNRIVDYYHFPKKEVVKFWEMPSNYYSFDKRGFHFIVLDANENKFNPNWSTGRYGSFIGEEQLSWLKEDLHATELPVIIFCHQGLSIGKGGVENAREVRAILERSHAETNYTKVQLVFTGHHHMNYHNKINGIHYIQINSMSYHWLGRKYVHTPYSDSISKKYPYSGFTAPYKDPLWAIAEINSTGSIKIRGKRSKFVGKSPAELGVPRKRSPIVPYISDREL